MKSEESDREKKSVIFSKKRGIRWGTGGRRWEIRDCEQVELFAEMIKSKRNGRQENGKDMLEEGNDRGLAPKTQMYWWGGRAVQGEWGSGCKEIPFTIQSLVMTTAFCSSSELHSYT